MGAQWQMAQKYFTIIHSEKNELSFYFILFYFLFLYKVALMSSEQFVSELVDLVVEA